MPVFLDERARCRGCLLGGAVGDALGAPVEFLNLDGIRSSFGAAGIRDFAPAYGRVGAITDDTQMTLFTAEGLLRAAVRGASKGICHPPSVVHRAYLRWLKTQGDVGPEAGLAGWLIHVPGLWFARAPGNTCLSALRKVKELGKPATNDSKGCGGVMRVAPVGLVAGRERAFALGSEVAALTHGHPSGYLSAGFLASLVGEIMAGHSLQEAIQRAKQELIGRRDHGEVLAAVEKAEVFAQSGPSTARVEELGQGWVAEEALGIALYCALAAPDLEEAVVLAVNHSGDSDSTGAIAGNICGVIYGEAAIPERWLKGLEMREEIVAIADDLAALREGRLDLENFERYPGC